MQYGKRLNEAFKERLSDTKGIENAVKDSYSYWTKKYYRLKEERDEKFTKRFIPGKIYTFAYKFVGDEKKLPMGFIDTLPVMLSLGSRVMPQADGTEKVMETGIDFNLVPYKVRPLIMDRIEKYYGQTLEANRKDISEGKVGSRPIEIDYERAGAVLRGTGWSSAYVTIDRGHVARVQVVDAKDWPVVMTLYTRGVVGKGLADVYGGYIKKMGQKA